MSTYLVAVAVSDYVYLRSTTAKGVKLSLYAPAEQISRGGLALNTAFQVLTYFEEFFGVAYPLPKLGKLFTVNCDLGTKTYD
jgi:aminopeptidase N